MSPVRRVLSSSIGTKLLIALTGLVLFLYLVLHLAGNLMIFAGAATFNEYGHKLASNKPLLYAAEVGLALLFLVHIYKAIVNYLANQRARPVGYAMKRWAGHTSRKSVASTTMIWTGMATLVFVVLHVRTFRFGTYYEAVEPGVRDLYRLEAEIFGNPFWVAFYVVAMGLVGLHVRHGFSSAFQSLGIDHPRYTKRLLALGATLALIIGAGFALIPVLFYFGVVR
jgi:succinate dehydrogenase / fumarate reductase cytochrome b subunit